MYTVTARVCGPKDVQKVGSVCVRSEGEGTDGVGVSSDRLAGVGRGPREKCLDFLQCGDDIGPATLSQSYFWSCMLSCSAL